MKFAIITYIEHSSFKGKYYSYEPYITEMNIWLKQVDEVKVLAPKVERKPLPGEIAYSENLEFVEVTPLNFTNFSNSINSVFRIPKIILKMFRIFAEADHIHLRCPGNISLLGCLVQIFFPKKIKTVKYAGNWDPKSNQPLSYKFQKWILGNTFLSKNLKVLAYGNWENQSANIIPFFTASFSESEIQSITKDFSGDLNFIFVGSFSEGKRPLFTIRLIESLISEGIRANLKLYGSGALQQELEEYIQKSGFSKYISLEGFKDKNELKRIYRNAHFLILPSKSEGWPKAVAEAMFFGCIPISTDISCVSWMLDKGKRGIIIEPEIKSAKVNIIDYIDQAEALKKMSEKAQEWSQQYTLEKFRFEINRIL